MCFFYAYSSYFAPKTTNSNNCIQIKLAILNFTSQWPIFVKYVIFIYVVISFLYLFLYLFSYLACRYVIDRHSLWPKVSDNTF